MAAINVHLNSYGNAAGRIPMLVELLSDTEPRRGQWLSARGFFRFEGVSPGVWGVRARLASGQVVVKAVTVFAGGTQSGGKSNLFDGVDLTPNVTPQPCCSPRRSANARRRRHLQSVAANSIQPGSSEVAASTTRFGFQAGKENQEEYMLVRLTDHELLRECLARSEMCKEASKWRRLLDLETAAHRRGL